MYFNINLFFKELNYRVKSYYLFKMFVILDIGGTNCRLGFFDSLKSTKPLNVEYLKLNNNFKEDRFEIFKKIKEIRNIKEDKIEGIAMAMAGSLDLEKFKLINAINLKSWENINLKDLFEKEFSCPVFIQNDTYMAALGEVSGLPKDKSFWYVNWGSGIGGALVKVNNGYRLVLASEIGHHSMGSTYPGCRCGQVGCWDSLASGKAIQKKFNTHPSNLILSEWKSIVPFMVQGLINILSISSTDYVVMGGGVSINQPEIVELISKKVENGLKIVKAPKFLIAKHKDLSAIFGGLELIKIENSKN